MKRQGTAKECSPQNLGVFRLWKPQKCFTGFFWMEPGHWNWSTLQEVVSHKCKLSTWLSLFLMTIKWFYFFLRLSVIQSGNMFTIAADNILIHWSSQKRKSLTSRQENVQTKDSGIVFTDVYVVAYGNQSRYSHLIQILIIMQEKLL